MRRRGGTEHTPPAACVRIQQRAACFPPGHPARPQEVKDGPLKEILAKATPADLGYMLRHTRAAAGGDTAANEAAKRRLIVQKGIPAIVQALILMPACRREERKARSGGRRQCGCHASGRLALCILCTAPPRARELRVRCLARNVRAQWGKLLSELKSGERLQATGCCG